MLDGVERFVAMARHASGSGDKRMHVAPMQTAQLSTASDLLCLGAGKPALVGAKTASDITGSQPYADKCARNVHSCTALPCCTAHAINRMPVSLPATLLNAVVVHVLSRVKHLKSLTVLLCCKFCSVAVMLLQMCHLPHPVIFPRPRQCMAETDHTFHMFRLQALSVLQGLDEATVPAA